MSLRFLRWLLCALALDLHVGQEGDEGMNAHVTRRAHPGAQRPALVRTERKAGGEAVGVDAEVGPRGRLMGKAMQAVVIRRARA